MRGALVLAGAAAALACVFAVVQFAAASNGGWSDEERRRIASLSLSDLPPLPPDPSNAVADDPAAAALGKALFFDTRLSGNGQVACATCHVPDRHFQDGTPLGHGIGTTGRRTMPIAGTAYSPWLFWDGRADSQWAQALGPLENPAEHGSDRRAIAAVVAAHYAEQYSAVFGGEASAMPVDRVFANVGKAIAAFERTLLPARSRFDRYADAMASGETSDALSADEQAGLRLFLGKASCINCHNGPLLTDNDFHNTGIPQAAGLAADHGRLAGAESVLGSAFNCLGPFSDAPAEACAELSYIKHGGEELERAFKTPSLREVAERAPFMHAGQVASLADVVRHYNGAPAAPAGHSEVHALGLSEEEQAQIVAFLASLSAE